MNECGDCRRYFDGGVVYTHEIKLRAGGRTVSMPTCCTRTLYGCTLGAKLYWM